MKKKLKIILTILSICLTLSVMGFGVYAATTVTFSISSSVSFIVTHVFADIEGKVYLDPVATKGTTAEVTYSQKTYTEELNGTRTLRDNIPVWNNANVAFTTSKNCIVYTLEIKNVAGDTTSLDVSFSNMLLKNVNGTTVGSATYVISNFDGTQPSSVTNLSDTGTINVAGQKKIFISLERTLFDFSKKIDNLSSWAAAITIANPAATNL